MTEHFPSKNCAIWLYHTPCEMDGLSGLDKVLVLSNIDILCESYWTLSRLPSYIVHLNATCFVFDMMVLSPCVAVLSSRPLSLLFRRLILF